MILAILLCWPLLTDLFFTGYMVMVAIVFVRFLVYRHMRLSLQHIKLFVTVCFGDYFIKYLLRKHEVGAWEKDPQHACTDLLGMVQLVLAGYRFHKSQVQPMLCLASPEQGLT